MEWAPIGPQLASTFGPHVGYCVDVWAKLGLGFWAVCWVWIGPPIGVLLPISRYGYCLVVADVCLCAEVLKPGGSWSSSGSGSRQASNHQVECNATFPYQVTMESQSSLKANIYAISSDTHQLQFIKLHHFKQERF